jgi:hypothetical protein
MSIPARTTYGVCGVCACLAAGIGYAPSDRQRILWVCDDPDCLTIARDTYRMRQIEWEQIEIEAIRDAGNRAGEWLDRTGKTDLATMTPEEWDGFCRFMVAAYRSQLAYHVAAYKSRITSNANPPPY